MKLSPLVASLTLLACLPGCEQNKNITDISSQGSSSASAPELSALQISHGTLDPAFSPEVTVYSVALDTDGKRVAMWHGDAGYDTWDADVAGERHRLVMAKGGFVFENTVETY